MQRTFRRLTLAGCCGLGLLAAVPATAAARSVTTLPANFVTKTSATLHGTIDTGGQVASYEFQYGTTTNYQAATPFQAITQPGQSYVAGTINQLRPNTTYHFRVLAVFYGIGGNYQEAEAGQDLTFTTQPTGRLGLMTTRLRVSGGYVSVPLNCLSKVACRGAFSISTQGATGTTAVCASRPFTVRPGKHHTFAAKVRTACASRLRKNPHHVLKAQFASGTRTGQRAPYRAIKLIG